MAPLVKMGTVGRPHGIKGEMGIDWHAAHIPAIDSEIFIGDKNPAPFRVQGVRPHQNRLLLTLFGIDDRTAADTLKGSSVFMAKDALPPLETDEAFVQDMIGADILLPDGTRLGSLDHIEFPANKMIWAIKTPEGREILFPAEPQFIQSLDPDNHTAIIAPPEGLLDIYRA